MAQDISDLFSMLPKDTGGLMSLADQGQQALDSGAVSPAEAKAAQKKMGIDTPKKAGDWLSNHLGNSSQPSDAQDWVQNYVKNGGAGSQVPKGAQGKTEKTTTDTTGTKQTRNVTLAPDQANDFFSMVRGVPEIANQSKGIDALQGQYDTLAAQRAPNDAWVKPLLALSDSVNGGKQADSFQSNSEKRNADLSKFANEIQQRRGDLSKTLLDSYGKLKAGQDQNSTNQTLKDLAMFGFGNNAGGNLANSREAMQAQRTMNNDPILKTYVPRLDGAKKILSLMDAAEGGDFKSNQAMLGQLNAEISRLETGSQSPGLNASEKTEMADAAAHYHNILDTITGHVTGVDLHQKFAQARGMVSDLGRSYVDAVDNRMNFLKSGALPTQTDIYEQKHAAMNNIYGSMFKKPTAAASGAPGKRTKELKDMTQDELDAYEASLHGSK